MNLIMINLLMNLKIMVACIFKSPLKCKIHQKGIFHIKGKLLEEPVI